MERRAIRFYQGTQKKSRCGDGNRGSGRGGEVSIAKQEKKI